MENVTYVVFSGGGVDYEPEFYGILHNLELARARLKEEILMFLREVIIPENETFNEENLNDKPEVVKVIRDDCTYFYVYPSRYSVEIGDYRNVFVLYKVK